MSNEEIEKLIRRLLSLISSDYDCECELTFVFHSYDICSTKHFYIYTIVDHTNVISSFVGRLVYEKFTNLYSILNVLLDPTYELWLYNRNNIKCEIPIAKKYGSTIEQLKITLDLKANI